MGQESNWVGDWVGAFVTGSRICHTDSAHGERMPADLLVDTQANSAWQRARAVLLLGGDVLGPVTAGRQYWRRSPDSIEVV
jgi:hypothetical protein